MIMLDDYERLKREHARDQKELDRIDGAMEQVMDEIKERFGCQTIEEARTMLSELAKKRAKWTDRYLRAKDAYSKSSKTPKKP